MAGYKVYRSGNNIEIYEYERMPIAEFEVAGGINEGILDRLNSEQSEKEDRTVERRLQTLRNNANDLKRMAREYFTKDSFFITLTYADRWACDHTEIDKSDRRTKSLWKKLRQTSEENFMDGDIKYVGVRELQKQRNVIHYHYIVSSEYLTYLHDYYSAEIIDNKKSESHKLFETAFCKKFWKFGFVDIRPIEGIDDTGAYLAKYMTKAKIKEMEWLEKRRLILRSENVKKIEPLCGERDSNEIRQIIEQIELYKSIAEEDIKGNSKRRRVFTNGYDSDYNGKVMYYDIHLDRFEK